MKQEKSSIKLSKKQYEIMETIRREGKYSTGNSQNKSLQKMIELGLCEWNSRYDGIIFTKKGKGFEL